MKMYFKKNVRVVSFLGVCSGVGQTLPGLEQAPRFLRESGFKEDLTNRSINVLDLGDIHPNMNSINNAWELIEKVRKKAFETLQNKQTLLTIGGDHSLAIGTIQATLMNYSNAKIIWVDAHGDINTPETSLTGNLHGMPLAALLGLFKNPIAGPKLLSENLLMIGVRDLDNAELNFLKELKIVVITAEEIRKDYKKTLAQVVNWLAKNSDAPIHLSFDLDSIDPSYAPATGLHVPGGLTLDYATKLIHQIAQTKKIVSLDLVEFNPLSVKNNNDLDLTISTIKTILIEGLTSQCN